MPTILICDDERDIVNALKIYLADGDYRLLEAFNGLEALDILSRETVDLILLDIMMPEMDGITAALKIRELTTCPIIMLTAKSEEKDIVIGLDAGADDYITKPFNPLEVKARVRSQLRRYLRFGSGAPDRETYVVGGIEMDDKAKSVTVDGEEVSLTPKEYEILKLFLMNPDRVFSPKEIYRQVWQEAPLNNDNTVAVHIRNLREKVEIDPAEPRYIKVLFGRGYKIEGGKRR